MSWTKVFELWDQLMTSSNDSTDDLKESVLRKGSKPSKGRAHRSDDI